MSDADLIDDDVPTVIPISLVLETGGETVCIRADFSEDRSMTWIYTAQDDEAGLDEIIGQALEYIEEFAVAELGAAR